MSSICSMKMEGDKVEVFIKRKDPIKENVDAPRGDYYHFGNPAVYETRVVIDPKLPKITITKSYTSPEKFLVIEGEVDPDRGHNSTGGMTNTNFWTVEIRREKVLVKRNGRKVVQNAGAEELLYFLTNIDALIHDLAEFLRDVLVKAQASNGCDDWRTLHF